MKFVPLLLAFVLALAGCASSNTGEVPLSTSEIPVPDETAFVSSGDMRISPLDMLDIKVFNSTGIDGAYQVDPNGNIKLPLLGDMPVKGYTTFELAALIETGLKEQYLRNPQVTVRISESNGQQFTIEGAIGKPGMYPVRGRLSLLQAIALSGGPTAGANLDGIVLFRTVEGKRQAARFDLIKIRNGQSVDPIIYGNDVIVVDGSSSDGAFEQILRSIPAVGMFMGLF
jgi:polysaccharide export outer membrane protein